VFRELDANNDGYFNSYELRNALNSVGMLLLLLLLMMMMTMMVVIGGHGILSRAMELIVLLQKRAKLRNLGFSAEIVQFRQMFCRMLHFT